MCAHLRCGGLSRVRSKDLGRRFCMKPAPVEGCSGWGRRHCFLGSWSRHWLGKKSELCFSGKTRILSMWSRIPTEKFNLCHQKHEVAHVGRDVERQEHLCAVVGVAAGAAAVKNRMGVLEKSEAEQSCVPARLISKGTENRILKRYLPFPVHCSVIHKSNDEATT